MIKALTDGRGADVTIEALGQQTTFENALRATRPGGTLSSLGVYSGKVVAPYEESDSLTLCVISGPTAVTTGTTAAAFTRIDADDSTNL